MQHTFINAQGNKQKCYNCNLITQINCIKPEFIGSIIKPANRRGTPSKGRSSVTWKWRRRKIICEPNQTNSVPTFVIFLFWMYLIYPWDLKLQKLNYNSTTMLYFQVKVYFNDFFLLENPPRSLIPVTEMLFSRCSRFY